jgi:tRNA A37 methylthiotransferase MiaB
MTSVCVAFALGCPRAQVDTARVRAYVNANGWSMTDRLEDADVVMVTTCGFNADSEVRSLSVLDSADARRKQGSRLIILGCLAEIDSKTLEARYDAALVPPVRSSDLDRITGARVRLADVPDPNVIEPHIEEASRHFDDTVRHPMDGRARAHLRKVMATCGLDERRWRRGLDRGLAAMLRRESVYSIRVAEGCLGECTYCAIRFAAGPLRSKPLQEVLTEFDSGLACGFTHFKFIAGDLGCYGQDIGTNIAELLTAVMERPGDFEVTLLDFDLKWFIAYGAALISLLARNQKRVRALLVPVQSGSELVLGRMRRGHTAGDARRVLTELRQACPDIALETHVLVGFPGETDRDFQDTIDLLRAVRFDRVEFYDYEDRPNTQASAMPAKIPASVIRARSARARGEIGGRWSALEYRMKRWSHSPSRAEGAADA